MKQPLISIIIPLYNKEECIVRTIESILDQEFVDYEIVIVDDGSTDNSVSVLRELNDNRIKLYLKQNGGPSSARNYGVKHAIGKWAIFLDADDLWEKDKLEKQLNFMKKNNCEFSFTGYEFADEKGIPNGKKVKVPATITYKQALKNTTIWTSTVMFDMDKLSKDSIYMPNVKRGQDTATWWKVLKKTKCAYGLNEVLSYYRRTNESLSANKLTALKRTWNLYRNVEKLGVFSSVYNFCWYCYNAVKRRI